MNIEQFFYVVEIADTCSFSQAARNLYISQPNLSHAVKQIEDKVGFPLFERTPKGVFPTARGREVIERFRILRQEYRQVEDFLRSPSPSSKLYLNIGALNVNRTSNAFIRIIQQYSKSPIHFSFLTYSYLDELLPLVENAQLDFAVVGFLSPFLKQMKNRLSNKSIEYVPINTAPICAAVGPQNPLYERQGSVSLEELYPYTIVQYGNPSNDPTHSVPYVIGLSNRCYGEVHVGSSQLFYGTLHQTAAVGLVSATRESYEYFQNLRLLEISDCQVYSEFGYIKSRRVPLSDIASQVLKEVSLLF